MKKIALVTGASGGIGLAICENLGKNGYVVIVNDINEEAGKKALKHLHDLKIEADLAIFDVTNADACKKHVDAIGAKYGHIDTVINGAGGVGKDTICDIVDTKYICVNKSSVDQIKEIAKLGGWDGEKDAKARKLLSDLKLIFSEYNDLPFNYMLKEVRKFINYEKAEILFVHIREPEEIKKFMNSVKSIFEIPCISLLIERPSVSKQWGNMADDNVKNINYDFTYINDVLIEDLPQSFLIFFDKVLEKLSKGV